MEAREANDEGGQEPPKCDECEHTKDCTKYKPGGTCWTIKKVKQDEPKGMGVMDLTDEEMLGELTRSRDWYMDRLDCTPAEKQLGLMTEALRRILDRLIPITEKLQYKEPEEGQKQVQCDGGCAIVDDCIHKEPHKPGHHCYEDTFCSAKGKLVTCKEVGP